MKQVGNTILAKGGNHILAKRDNSAWPKGSKLSGFSRKKGFVLFNRNLNVLGNAEHARLEELPLERFNVEEIPLDGEIVEEHAGFTDVFFYTDLTSPYAGYALNLQKLKAYNRFMFPLAMALNRKL